MDESRKSSVSGSSSNDGIGEFWDSHDFTQYDAGGPDVDFEVTLSVPLEVDLFAALEKQARLRGIHLETLVNLWLQQKLSEQPS